jgi:uncharacterized protein (TIGR03083 family)
MAQPQQYYDGAGVPMVVPSRPPDVARAWHTHRVRLRTWLAGLPPERWEGPTRCSTWSVAELVAHLASGAQFLGYTLHEAKKGKPTRLLESFDAQVTPGAAAAVFAGLSPGELLKALVEVDDRVRGELEGFDGDSWELPAEAPLGRVPAFVSVNHFVFDSWVHERDLMLPLGEEPTRDANEVAVVASYVVALAGVGRRKEGAAERSSLPVDVRTTEPALQICAVRAGEGVAVAMAPGPEGAARVFGCAVDVIDFATGRHTGERIEGDPSAIGYLGRLAEAMA